jgi:hypothetical protein
MYMPHLPQPARVHVAAVAISRVMRHAAKSPLPEVQAPLLKHAVREPDVMHEIELLASEIET